MIVKENKLENTPSGGALVGKRKGQTMIHNKGSMSGYLVGKTHAEGGIKAINKSTGQPLEMQGGEVVITAPAVSDQTKRKFEGKMMTNREILSAINEKGGGVSFAQGGELPSEMQFNGTSYNYGGKMLSDHDIAYELSQCGCEHEMKKGGGVRTSKVVTYKDKYNRKYNYPKNTSHTLEEISKDTNVSMKGLRQIYNKGIGAYKTNPASVRPNVKSKEQWAMARVYSAVMGGKASKVDSNELKMNVGGGVSKNSLVKDSRGGNHASRDLNNYNDMMDVAVDGQVGSESGLAFANGGDLSFLDNIDNVFYQGGTIGNDKVTIAKIVAQSSTYSALNGRTFNTFQELKKAIRDEFNNQNKRAGYFYFEANGVPPRFPMQIKDGKNTVLNFNPNTGDADDFEKQLLRRASYSYKKYDWNDWYSGRVSASTSTASVSHPVPPQLQRIDIFTPKVKLQIDQLPDTNFGINNDLITNLPDSIQGLLRTREFEQRGSIGATSVQSAFNWGNTIEGANFWNDISNGDFREFKKMYGSGASGSNVSASTASVPQLTFEDLAESQIWVGDNAELSKAIQEKAFALGFKWGGDESGNPQIQVISQKTLRFWDDGEISTRDFKTKEEFDRSTSLKKLTPADLGIDVNNLGATGSQQMPIDLTTIPKSRAKVLFEIKKFVDDNKLTPNPAVVETLPNKIDFVDEETGDVFEFSTDNKLLNPKTKIASELLFQFLDFEKGFDDFASKKINELSDGIADLNQLAVEEVVSFEKEQKEISTLTRLLPSFQQSKFASQKAMILKEISRLHKKITYEGFISQNESNSRVSQLFTPQGLLKYYYTQTTQSPVAPLEPACELPTPNGGKSKLPLSTYFNVRTSRFKKWFGDWEKAYETNNYVDCSKMIDEETKEPKIFYHGVRKYVPNFGQFSNMGQGVVRPYGSFEPPTAFPASFFSDSEEYAKFYGGEAPNMPKPTPDYEPFIYKVFLSAKNPISLLPLGFESSYKDVIDYLLVAFGVRVQPSRNVLDRIQNDMKSKHPLWVYVRNDIALLETLKEYGYDALIQTGDIPTFDTNGEVINDRSKFIQDEEYLTFYPTQVKSATVKKSFYFDFFKDVRFKQGGYVRI
jgi:hypothetical protein